MIRTATTYVLLAAYSAIALCGQGLHFFTEGACDHLEGGHAACWARSKPKKSCCHSHAKHCHEHGKHHASNPPAAPSHESGHAKRHPAASTLVIKSRQAEHDCASCIICLHQSQGQWYQSAAIDTAGADVCPDSPRVDAGVILIPVLHCQAQPRAPPTLG